MNALAENHTVLIALLLIALLNGLVWYVWVSRVLRRRDKQLHAHTRPVSSDDIISETITSSETERERVAEILHDDFGPVLSLLRKNLIDFKQETDARKSVLINQYEQNIQLVNELIYKIRNLSKGLQPAVLKSYGIAAAGEDFVDFMNNSTSIQVNFNFYSKNDTRLPFEVELVLYRALQEGINNAFKHAHCSQVDVTLHLNTPAFLLEVMDDGKGIDSEPHHAGIGLLTMKHRVAYINAIMEVVHEQGGGTVLRIRSRNYIQDHEHDKRRNKGDAG